ncbi:MAG: hypothetical protein RL199_1901, partial [Pseudomonadota bacterium]
GPDAGDGRLTCSCIAKLDLGGRCGSDVDCLSGVCQGNVGTPTVSPRCVLATCRDGLKNGTETGVDCGGSCEQRCALGTVCGVNADCDKGLLCGGDVKPYTCRAARSEGLACTRDWQCATGACVAKLCRAVGTTNALCDTKPDCDSLVCTNARCAAPKYTDRARNGSETDVDCGGSGTGFKACVAGQKCSVAGDCKAGFTCSGGVCGAALSAACSKPIDCLSGLCGKPTGTTKNVCLEKYPDDDARHCSNKVPDADETDVDCGGAACGPCADKLKCGGENDCQSGVCTTTGQCAPPSCKDGVQNGSETAVDCGGTKCGKCSPGVAAPDAASCASGVRSTDLGVCLDATCFDGLKNGLEKGVDCGGACAPCGTGGTCTTTTAAADCASGVCSAATKTCQGPTASDRVKNGDETDANCGGSSGKGCALKKRCGKDADCVSGAFCANGICAPPMCTNNVLDKSAGEVDIDCGGSCGLCSDGKLCTAATQCASGVCAKATGATAKTCAAPTATDKLKNGDEMGVDCGGPNAPGCGYASPCRDGGDCAGGMVCLGGRCNFGACGNTTKTSGATTCGRLCSALCRDGNPCRGSVDCGGEGECVEGQDGQPKCVTRKCVIDGVNYKPGEQSLSDPCRVCDPEAAPVADGDVGAFVVRNDGDVCDDHDPATWGDRCRATTGSLACSGTAFTCTVADGEVCVAKNDPVPDGQRCEEDVDCDVRGATGAKTCVNGRCEGAQCKASLYGNTHACGSTGDCVSGGRCDGVSRTCPTSRLLVDVECRAASGACDEPERCDGVNAACPTTDATKNAGDECLAGTKGGHCRSDSGALACVPCALNEKWNGSACEACPSGSTSPGGAATACQAISCAMNKYWPGRGTTCVACPAGSTSPGGAVSECTLCSTSQWWDGRKCVECPVGHVSDGGTSGFCVVSPCTLEGGSALDFGQVAQTYTARRDYTVSNSGSQDCVLSSGAFVSSGAAVAFGVALAPPPSTVVSPGQTEKLTLTYTPADAVGPDQGELSIRYRANDQGAAENILRVQLTGTPTDRPSCVLLTYPGPSAPLGNNRVLNFGQVKKGTEKELPVTFQNAGSLPCTINGATVSAGTLAGLGGPNDAPFFRIKSPPASVLQPGDSTSIVVGFSPDASRAYGGDFGYLLGGALGGFGLSLEVNTSDTVSFNGSTCGGSILGGGGSPGCVAWALSGQGVSSELSVLPGDVDFGKVTLSCNSRRQKVTLYNTGLVPMTLKSFKVDPAVQPPVFKVIGPATPYMLAGGGQVAFEFVFRPSVGGVHAASLLIESDATNVSSANPYVAVGLKGDGTTETHATDRFDQNIKPKTDVLFVVDNSGSMGEEQKLLGDNAQRFLDTASQLNSDFHVAVVTTDMTEPSQSGHFQTRGG